MTQNLTSQAVDEIFLTQTTSVKKVAIAEKFKRYENAWIALSMNPSSPVWLKEMADELLVYDPLAPAKTPFDAKPRKTVVISKAERLRKRNAWKKAFGDSDAIEAV